MRRKLCFKYFIYILLLCILIFLKEYVLKRIGYIYKRTWGAGGTYFLLIIIPFIFNFIIGLILGIEYFIGERRKEGSWKIILPKVILVGLPSLFFSSIYLLACIENTIVQNLLLIFATLGTNFVPILQIILGYVVITCLYKSNENVENNR